MLRIIRYKRLIAVKFLLIMVLPMIWTSVAHASTGVSASKSGPTVPEVSSFEPYDASEMVDMLTGDLSYSIPMLDIPGPAGSYAMSLSYQGGVKVLQEPSWVGLGWNVTPGAINRTVSGVADDHSGEEESYNLYGNVGEASVLNIGVSAGYNIGGVATVGGKVGIQVIDDSNGGREYGFYHGPNLSVLGYSGGFTSGISPDGGSYTSANASAGISSYGMSLYSFANVSTNNGLTYGAGISVSAAGSSVLGSSISKNNGNISTSESVGGVGVNKSPTINSGDITSKVVESSKMTGNFYFGTFNVSRDKVLYYYDKTDKTKVFGSLYSGEIFTEDEGEEEGNFQSDVYNLFNPDEGLYGEDSAPIKNAVGTYPDYDSYNVFAQGLFGSFEPTSVEEYLVTQSNYVNEKVSIKPDNYLARSKQFRFLDSFSNKLKTDKLPNIANIPDVYGDVPFFLNDGVFNINNGSQEYFESGYDETDSRLLDARHIEYYTNQQVIDNPYIDLTNAKSYVIREKYPQQIGGYKITKADGMTYHFMLPVYSFSGTTYTINASSGYNTSSIARKAPYAYSWLLTAITGPDYVDRSGIKEGEFDEGDFGYWVSFGYSQWDDEYWSYPESGLDYDMLSGVGFRSEGEKEKYYLDEVATASHTALFVKSYRPYDANKSAKLDAVYLFDNRDWNNMNMSGYRFEYDDSVFDDRLKALESNCIKKYQFDYSVFKSGDYRLRLDKFWTKGEKATIVTPPAIFEYKELHDGLGWDQWNFYDPEKYDLWGFYKSDYNTSGFNKKYSNKNIDRMRTSTTTSDASMWSLNQIITPTGQRVKIDYESDDYSKVNLNASLFEIFEIVDNDNSSDDIVVIKVTEEDEDDFSDLLDYCKMGAPMDLKLLYEVGVAGHSMFLTFDFNDLVDAGTSEDQIQIQSNELQFLLNLKDGAYDYSTSPTFLTTAMDAFYNEYDSGAEDIYYRGDVGKLKTEVLTLADLGVGVMSMSLTTQVNKDVNGESYQARINKIGGNLRVKQVVSEIPVDEIKKVTEYIYQHPDFASLQYDGYASSGEIIYEPYSNMPFGNRSFASIIDFKNNNPKDEAMIAKYLNHISGVSSRIISNARLLPAPQVVYRYITKKAYTQIKEEQKIYSPLYATFEFQGFEDRMISHTYASNDYKLIYSHLNKESTLFEDEYDFEAEFIKSGIGRVDNLLSQMGSLKSIVQYDSKNDQPLSKTVYHYLHDEVLAEADDESVDLREFINSNSGLPGNNYVEAYEELLNTEALDYQGVFQEAFSTVRIADFTEEHDDDFYVDAVTILAQIFAGVPALHDVNIDTRRYEMATVTSQMNRYPTINTGESNYDYRTGTVKTVKNNRWDRFSGQVIESESTDGNNNKVINIIEPAYWHYPEMGPKRSGEDNKHMLTQSAAQIQKIIYPSVDESEGEEQVASAAITTWSNLFDVLHPDQGILSAYDADNETSDVWRKKATYTYLGDLEAETTMAGSAIADFDVQAIVPFGQSHDLSITDYNWIENPVNVKKLGPWQKNGEITLYDANTHPLEVENEVSGQFSATRMTKDQKRVIATATNSRYEEMVFAGAEELYEFGQENNGVTSLYGVSTEGTIMSSEIFSHTGENYISATGGQVGFRYNMDLGESTVSKKYKAMVWCYMPAQVEEELENVQIIATCATCVDQIATPNMKIKTYGSWHPIELIFTVPQITGSTTVEIKCMLNSDSEWSVSFDDFRVQPYTSGMLGYVYNSGNRRLSYTLDNNNFYTQYKYDALGRLTDVVREIDYYVPRFENSHRYFNKFTENKN